MAGTFTPVSPEREAPEQKDPTDQIAQEQDNIMRLASRIVNFGSFAGVYALILICLSTIFVLSAFLRPDAKPSATIYPHVFSLTIHGLGAVFIFVMYARLHRMKIGMQGKDAISVAPPSMTPNQLGINNMGYEPDPPFQTQDMTSSSSLAIAMKGLTIDELKHRLKNVKPLSFDGEGVSFFSRMGLLGFGLGATLLDGARLMQYNQNPLVWDCYGPWYLASSSVNIFYHWVLMFFLLKFHTAVINFRRAIIKFGLAHLMASNISTWISTVVIEGTMGIILSNETTNITEDYGKILMFGCIREVTIYDGASQYLYPFTIEFSLLSAALVYRIYKNVGAIVIHEDGKSNTDSTGDVNIEHVDCHKSHTGLFYGFIVFLGIVCATVMYIYYDTTETIEYLPIHEGIEITHFIHLITGIAGNSIGVIVLIPAALKLRKLHFNGELDCVLDVYLLVVAVLGYYMLFGLVAMVGLYHINDSENVGFQAHLLVGLCAIEYTQATLLVITLIDGLHRRAGTVEHEREKPGRSLVTFQIVLNMGLWIVNTFLLRGIHHMEIISNFYGHSAWSLMVKVFLPLSIFFRFHAAVCFADIWHNAYRREKSSTVHLLEVAQKFDEDTNF